MLTRRIVVTPEDSFLKEFQGSGVAVRVVSGACLGMHISFTAPSLQGTTLGTDLLPLVNGEVYFPKNTERFERFWINSGPLAGPIGALVTSNNQENLVLEVFDCAQPVVVLNDGAGRGWRYHLVANTLSVSLGWAPEDDAHLMYSDNFKGLTTVGDDFRLGHYVPGRWIGGGIRADGKFTAYILQHVNHDNSFKVELARWTADSATATTTPGSTNWQSGISFETGGQPLVNSAAVANPGGGLIAWPMFGISIYIKPITAITTTQLHLYARD